MENIFDYFTPDLFWFLICVFNFLCNVISFFRTGNLSKKTKNYLEDFFMAKFSNFKSELNKKFSQSFDTEVTQYRLNKSTGLLEELPDKIDLQQRIDSYKDTALQSMLSALDPVTSLDTAISTRNELMDELDALRSSMDFRSDMCEKYKLDPYLSFEDLEKELLSLSSEAKGQVEALSNVKQKFDKEVKDNGLSQTSSTPISSDTSQRS